MAQPAPFTTDQLIELLATHYGLSATQITFLPIGNDSASYVYQVEHRDGPLFLKLRRSEHFAPASLAVPAWLGTQGIKRLITPRATLAGAAWADLGAFVLTLFPFIELRTAASAGLSLDEWQALGASVRRFHDAAPPPELRALLAEEAFIPWRAELLPRLAAELAAPRPDDAAHTALRTFWHARTAEIARLEATTAELAAALRARQLPLRLCHADLHTWNINVGPDGHAWIVDWDQVLLAPRERDLMFVVGGIARSLVRPAETAAFLAGYGPAEIDPAALAYFRYAWAIQDLAAGAEEVLLLPDRAPESRMAAVEGIVDLFAPGSIVEIATSSAW